MYHARCVGGDAAFGEQMELELEGEAAIIEKNGRRYQGRLDSTYRPRTHKNFVRYIGFAGFDEECGTEVLVEKQVLAGARYATMKVQARGEGYFSACYRCTRQE